MTRLEEVRKGKEGNYIFPFFWQHGEDEKTLREYMRIIRESNIREVCVESRPHPDFVGEKWWQDMDVILEEAEKLDMKVWILDDSHFPTGYANGAVKNAPDALTHQYLVYRTLEMQGPARHLELDIAEYMQPEPPAPWMPPAPAPERDFQDDELVRILACPVGEGERLGGPIDLTGLSEGNRLVFDLPDGYYRIYVIYLTRKARGRNDYINFMDPDSCRLLVDAVYEPHYAHYAKYFGNRIAGFFSDEPPIGNVEGYMPAGPIGTPGQNLPWSALAADRFTEEYGSEDWMTYLPYLWAEALDRDAQAKERNAYMQMVTKLVQQCFSDQIGGWCRSHGVEYIGHMLEDCDINSDLGISLGHFFRGLAGQDMAGIDNIGGQVMINGEHVTRHPGSACPDEAGFYHYLMAKLGTSHAAIDPKKRGRCMCENFGAYGWQYGMDEFKFMLDHFMARGVNRFVPHAFSPAAFPDPDCPPHFYAHGENPQYRAFGELMKYANRVCHLIDGGKAHPDVALLYNAESKWAGNGDSNIPAARALANAQVDFHVIPSDVFADDSEYPLEIQDGCFRVNQISYRALIISGSDFIDKNTARFLGIAVENRIPVLFLDRMPRGISGAGELENGWLHKVLSDCRIVPTKEIGSFCREHLTTQAAFMPRVKKLVSYHYLSDQERYLILNEEAETGYSGEAVLQKEKDRKLKTIIRYDAWDNVAQELDFEDLGEAVRLPLQIRALELCILTMVYEEEEQSMQIDRAFSWEMEPERVIELTEFSVVRVESTQYPNSSDPGMTVTAPFTGMQELYPEYSGYYRYETSLILNIMETERRYYLHIEDTSDTVEVFVNGKSAGMRVQKPWRFDITELIRSGENQIMIETATTLERKVKAMGKDIRSMSPYRPLSSTGILGKVEIMIQ